MPRIHETIAGLVIENDYLGLVTLGSIPGSPVTLATAASTFSIGCVLADSTNGLRYQNVGTVAVPSWRNMQGYATMSHRPATIATTGNSDDYFIVPESGVLDSIDFSAVDALAASDTNYITWTLTNLGQAGAGTTVMLAATAANTTKVTGGTALAANTRRQLTLSGTAANLVVTKGDRLFLRAAATGTLGNTVTFPNYLFRINVTA